MKSHNRRSKRAMRKNFKDGVPNRQGVLHMALNFEKVKPALESRIRAQLKKEGVPFRFDFKDKSFSVDPLFEDRQKDLERIIEQVNKELVDEIVTGKPKGYTFFF